MENQTIEMIFNLKIFLKYGILMCCWCVQASRPFVTNETTFFSFSNSITFYSILILNLERLWGMQTCAIVKILLFYFMKKITLIETLIEEKISVYSNEIFPFNYEYFFFNL